MGWNTGITVSLDSAPAQPNITTTTGAGTAGNPNLLLGVQLGNADVGLGSAPQIGLSAITVVPEPTSTMLLALGSFAFVVRRRR